MTQFTLGGFCPVSDECYLYFEESFKATKKKKTWKDKILAETGQKKCVTHRIFNDAVVFVCMDNGSEVVIVSESIMDEVGKSGVTCFDGTPQAPSAEEFHQIILSRSTGNHKGKTHKIRVKTETGQPVRG